MVLGSCLHVVRALSHPRWEDYDYEPLDGQQNRFHWLGNGWTLNETNGGTRTYNIPTPIIPRLLTTCAVSWYLDDVDFPPGLS